ncbi:MAG: diacylglycerol kinase [Gammaproteobacteria bacterium]|nr:diacylglycerol kinase [Gammaproteobacteria bacterium]
MNQPLNKPNGTGIMRIVKATKCSWLGFKAAFRHEAAFRQELLLIIIMAPLALLITQHPIQLALLWSSLVFVLFAETANSAIEAVVDRIGLEHHELSGRAKDLGSLMVTLAILIVLIIWGGIIYQNFFS